MTIWNDGVTIESINIRLHDVQATTFLFMFFICKVCLLPNLY